MSSSVSGTASVGCSVDGVSELLGCARSTVVRGKAVKRPAAAGSRAPGTQYTQTVGDVAPRSRKRALRSLFTSLLLRFVNRATEPGLRRPWRGMPVGMGQGVGGCAAVLTPLPPSPLSPGHLPPVASNHPVLPQIHLPLPGGTAGEHWHPVCPQRFRVGLGGSGGD